MYIGIGIAAGVIFLIILAVIIICIQRRKRQGPGLSPAHPPPTSDELPTKLPSAGQNTKTKNVGNDYGDAKGIDNVSNNDPSKSVYDKLGLEDKQQKSYENPYNVYEDPGNVYEIPTD